MADISPFFVNPDYATPEQIAQQRQYASKLLGNQMEITGGRTGWAQGASNIVNALMGGILARDAGVQQQRSRQMDIANILGAMTPTSQPGMQISQNYSLSPAVAFNPSSDNPAANAISGIESGGKYDSLGPITKTGDRAYGKYQVMGNNIPQWTQAALGSPMTPDQFLASPEAQEAVFKNKFGEYTNKYGPEGAARAWFAGEGNMNNPNAKDQLGTSVADYSQKFTGTMPQDALAFNGPQNGLAPVPPSPQPAPQGGLALPQGQPMGVNMPLIQALMGAQNLDPRMVGGMMQMAAPQMIEGPGGTYARNPITGQTQLVMPKVEKDTFKSGGTEFPMRSTFNPRTGQFDTVPIVPSGSGNSTPPTTTSGTPSNTQGPFGGAQPFIDQATQNEANKARKKTVAEEGAKATMAPLAEIGKEAKTSAQAINFLNLIEDTAKNYGDKVTTGPFADSALKLKQAVNGVVGKDVMGDTAPAELMNKMNANLASAATAALTARGTQFDFKTFMESSPGLKNSIKGTVFLSNVLKQVHQQALDLNQKAQDPANWENWAQVQADYYKNHPIVNPLTGHELRTTDSAVKESQGGLGIPKVGEVVNGHKFLGGNPNDQKSWEKVQ